MTAVFSTIGDKSVQVRRIVYNNEPQPMLPVVADDPSDGVEESVLDPVMLYNPHLSIVGYYWDNVLGKQVAEEEIET